MTEPNIPVADELTEASKYAEVVDPLNSLENPEFLTAEELVRVMHPVFDEQIINYGAYNLVPGLSRRGSDCTNQHARANPSRHSHHN